MPTEVRRMNYSRCNKTAERVFTSDAVTVLEIHQNFVVLGLFCRSCGKLSCSCARISLEKEDHDVAVRNFQCDPQVKDLTGQGRRPPAGSESCVDRWRGRLRSVDSEYAGGAIEPRDTYPK